MAWHHPTVTLEAGTLQANARRVFTNGPAAITPGSAEPGSTALADLQLLVVDCIKEAAKLGADNKRKAQRLVGTFVDTLRVRMDNAEAARLAELMSEIPKMPEKDRCDALMKARQEAVTEKEREILDHLCGRICQKDAEGEEDDAGKSVNSSTDLDDKCSTQEGFILSFLTFLYSGNYPKGRHLQGFGFNDFGIENKDANKGKAKDTGVGPIVNELIDWLVKNKFYTPIRGRGELDVKMTHTPGSLIETMQEKGTIAASVDIRIRDDSSAVENFLFFNKLTSNSRRIVPLTSSQQPFLSFSERELGLFFWKRDVLKEMLLRLAQQDDTPLYTTNDLETWIGSKEPGFIIKRFLCDTGAEGLTSRQRKKAGHRAAVKMWSLDEVRMHLEQFKKKKERKGKKAVKDKEDDEEEEFNPVTYDQKGYVSRGSIRTDGFRIQLLAFKLRELQAVRYRHLEERLLPDKLTSTIGGTDYYLPEIRNVITCKEDLERFWPGIRAETINTLTLDGGQACVIGAFAHLPDELAKAVKDNEA
ncbi:hypothetical protein BGX24_006357, partial [Mortierella sp. AD032]